MKILILGESGSGKTFSIKNLDPIKTYLIKTVTKSCPWKGGNKNYNTTNSLTSLSVKDIIHKLIELRDSQFRTIIIDDFQYLMGIEYMERANEDGWNKFSDINTKIYFLLKEISKTSNIKDVIIFSHIENSIDVKGNNSIKIKTIGKMLDQNITIEGLFDTVLYTDIKLGQKGREYCFRTNTNGKDTCKSPNEMFDEYIPNDLNYVIKTYHEYFK